MLGRQRGLLRDVGNYAEHIRQDIMNDNIGFFANVAVAGVMTAQNYLGNSYKQYKEEKEEEEEIKFRNPRYAEEERRRNRKDIDFIMNSELKDNPILNPVYDKLIDKLKKLNDKVSSITNINGISNDVLLQELKYTVLLKHFQNVKPSEFDLLSYASIGDWCGKNSNILNNLRKETNYDSVSMNSMQRICKMHDLAYSKSVNKDDIYEADVDMLKSIVDMFYIKGIKSNIDEPIVGFVDYISNQLNTAFTTGILNPANVVGSIVNLGFAHKLYSNVRDFSQQSYYKNAVDLVINADRIISLLSFAGIGLKVLWDASVGRFQGVYGFEETRFKPEEIKEILIDFEKNINQHLEMTGYDSIDMFKLIDLPEEEFEKAIDIKEQEPVIQETIGTQTLSESEEESVDDIFNNTREATEDEIDITEGELNSVNDIINYLKSFET